MASYKISQRAEDDLQRIYSYGVEHYGLIQADNNIVEIVAILGKQDIKGI